MAGVAVALPGLGPHKHPYHRVRPGGDELPQPLDEIQVRLRLPRQGQPGCRSGTMISDQRMVFELHNTYRTREMAT